VLALPVTVGFMLPIDRALLVSEFAGSDHGEACCPSCRSYVNSTPVHLPDCAHDLALSERGYPDQESRDRARALLKQAEGATIPPPPEPVFSAARWRPRCMSFAEAAAFRPQRFTAPRPVVEHCMGNDCSDKVACECMCPKCCPPV
jgi:hypothetical protein